MTPNGNIYPGKDLWPVTDFSKHPDPWYQTHLIHEMTHVWQRQNGVNVLARGVFSAVAPYNYVLKPGKSFDRYSMEQQATIVQDYLTSLQGETQTRRYRGKGWRSVHPPEVYEALIPWLKDGPKETFRKAVPSPNPPLP